jgi:hypothetical protein
VDSLKRGEPMRVVIEALGFLGGGVLLCMRIAMSGG